MICAKTETTKLANSPHQSRRPIYIYIYIHIFRAPQCPHHPHRAVYRALWGWWGQNIKIHFHVLECIFYMFVFFFIFEACIFFYILDPNIKKYISMPWICIFFIFEACIFLYFVFFLYLGAQIKKNTRVKYK